jgi:hypothetical protein
MRLNQSKIQRGKKNAAGRQVSASKLKKRADLAAMAVVRRKFAGKKGMNYANLTQSQKVSIDNLVSKQVQSKTVKAIAKTLLPKIRQAANANRKGKGGNTISRRDMAHKANNPAKSAAPKPNRAPALHPPADPKKHIKENVSHLNKARASIQRTGKHRRGRHAQPAQTSNRDGGSDAGLSRATSNAVTGKLRDLGIRFDSKNPVSVANFKKQMKRFRDQVSKMPGIERMKANKHRRRAKGRRDSTKNDWSMQNVYADMSDITFAVQMLKEDVVQDRIESLFIRGMVPKGQIQRYKRLLNDPKRYIRFRQYHDEFLDLLRKMMEYTAEDDVIFQKVRNKVMSKNHGRN